MLTTDAIGACDAGVHAPSLAQTGHVARQHKVHYHDDHGEDHILPSGVLEAGVGLEHPLHLHEEVHHLRKHLGKQEGEESAQAVALGVIVEDQEVERLRSGPVPEMKMAVPIHVTTKRVMVEMFDSTLNRMNSQMFG